MLSIREKIRMLSIRKKIAKSKSTTPPNKTLPSPVFSIPELLEQILYHTEPHDLLSLQGIKKTFQGVIQSSRSLQRKLFFDVKILPEGGELAEVKWNPFIQRFSDDQAYNPYGRRSFSSASFERLGYPKASWKDMFITCPATNSLAIYGGEGDGMFYLTSIAGITLGQLAKAPKQYYYLRIDRLKGFWAAHKPFTVGAAQRVSENFLRLPKLVC